MIRYCSSSFSQQLRQGLRSSKQCSVFVGLGFYSRSFGGTSEANELEQGPAEKTLKEAPVTRPLARSSRTNSKVRHLKERGFDDIIEREKKLKIVLSIKELLWAEPSRCMTLLELGTHKDDIGFNGNGRLVEFLRRYPGVFTVHETAEFGKLPWFQLTPEAEVVAQEESDIQKSMDKEGVTKLRKLLMMSTDRTLALSKIAHLGRDLGLPDDFRESLVYEYPMYFRVLENQDLVDVEGPKLELVRWSPRLAVTEDAKKAQEQSTNGSLSMSEDPDTRKRSRFDEVVCPSPYQGAKSLHRRSLQFEKRAVLLIQELLSLTLEKRVLVDHLTHFRREFHFSKKLHGMLIRHPDYFYVSRKGSRDTVFLRGAFKKIDVGGNRKEYALIDKHPLVLVKEKFAALVGVERQLDFNSDRYQVSFREMGVPSEAGRRDPTPGSATLKVPW